MVRPRKIKQCFNGKGFQKLLTNGKHSFEKMGISMSAFGMSKNTFSTGASPRVSIYQVSRKPNNLLDNPYCWQCDRPIVEVFLVENSGSLYYLWFTYITGYFTSKRQSRERRNAGSLKKKGELVGRQLKMLEEKTGACASVFVSILIKCTRRRGSDFLQSN